MRTPGGEARGTNLAGRAGRWSAAHWKSAAFGWLGFAVAAVAVGSVVGARQMEPWAVTNGESRRAEQILDRGNFDIPARESVLVQSRTATVDEPAFSSAVAGVVQTLSHQRDVIRIISPIENPRAGLVSADRHSALVQFDVRGDAEDAKDRIAPILEAIDGVQSGNPGVIVEEFGKASADHLVAERFDRDIGRAEVTSVPLTIAILVIAFGALVAAGLPVLLALSAVLAATGLNSLASHVVPTDQQTLSAIILMIGMAVGIDYSLFYLRREREERQAGSSPHDALLHAARTSGQAVLISGATVLIAMAGMFVSGNSLFTTIGLGTMIVVLAAMIGSLTVLPALLHRLGDNVDRVRMPLFRGRPRDDGAWGRVVGAVLRRPASALLASGGALAIAAIPAFGMHTKLPNFTDFPRDLKIVRTYDRIQRAFPGSQTPAQVVVKAPDVQTPRMRRAYDLFRERALATGEFQAPFSVVVNPDRTVARIDFAIAGNGDDAESIAALHTLRETVIPPIAQTLPDAEVAVTGITAGTYDFNHQMAARLPFVFLFVLGLAFVLLLLTFRSIVIAATAVALNLLSVGAAYGILVAVFQHGWLAGPLGFQTNGAIVSWLPLFLFVVLFGLSMDYHVFILSRVKELHDAGASTDDAVRLAITRTAGTVTSAAVIMVAVFGLFATLSLLMMQQMGFGLAVAVLIDATVVRAVLVPATMKLLGERNWYLPRRLEWLPSLSPEGAGPSRPGGRPLPGH
ncbi:MAG TPA: MMPL family transporter [Gaiellaceae bacterium]|nr:MMPL family transporter [Gaiellaceae bacterium]